MLLTRVPAGARGLDERAFARSVMWFPIVGALVGLCVAGVYAACRLALPTLVSAALGLAFGVVVTGALHEDGLGDVADAVAGGSTRERRLEILKDPRQGTYGVLAIVFSVLLRVSAIAALRPRDALLALPAAHALGRAAAVALLASTRSAREGLGASYASRATPGRAAPAVVAAVAIAAGTMRAASVAAVALAASCVVVVRALAARAFGGATGDVAGAAEQATEVFVLLLACALGR